ncbi:glycine-rich cell wall structural protein-like [Lolium rigidum]|uniref:glycine-rich cell wall structural protein-like n=1 Tax=Lolium rigidum TaxID=89674 RepID=UPI001F5C9332|nr:glycine-rich cell wall structural protein-like [Lolium rigidum]
MASTKGLLLVVLTLLLAAAFLVAGGAAGRTQAKEEEAEAGVPRGHYHHGGVSGADAHGSGCKMGCCGRGEGRCRCCANADEIPEPMYRPAVEVHN